MGALLGLDELQRRTHGVGGGIGGAAQQRVGNAHLHEHRAEIVALLEIGLALLGSHLALAELDHRLDHLVHFGIGRGIEDLKTFDVKAALLGSSLHLVNIADEHRREKTALLQARGGLEDTGIGALGIDDLAGIGFQNVNQIFKHDVFLHFDDLRRLSAAAVHNLQV